MCLPFCDLRQFKEGHSKSPKTIRIVRNSETPSKNEDNTMATARFDFNTVFIGK